MSEPGTTMRAAQFLGPDQLTVRTVALPTIGEGEALVAIEACGFCGSDLSIIAGTHPRARPPLTVGHELAGRIVEMRGQSSQFGIGDRVTAFPLISCGTCYACTHGHAHVCRNLKLFGFDVDGGMAQFVRLPLTSLVHLPDAISDAAGALIEPLAVAVHGVSRTSLACAELGVVLGAGPIGLLTALVAKARGIPHVIISDVSPHRLQLAAELGFEAVLAGEVLRDRVISLTNSNGADVLYECAGHPSVSAAMTSLARSRGVIVNLGVFKEPVEIDMRAVNFKELEIYGSRVYERANFEEAVRLAERLPIERLITGIYRLEDVQSALEEFKDGQGCKVLINPQAMVA